MKDSIVLLKPVADDIELQIARTIRNACRTFMTRSQEEITEEKQRQWWSTVDKDTLKLYTLNKIYHGAIVDPVGYGLIRVEDGSVLLSGGLIESERGKGLGYDLFNLLVENSKPFDLPIRLEVLKTNIAGYKTYLKVGFVVTHETDTVYTMEYNNDSSI